jgi:hypothetical protein
LRGEEDAMPKFTRLRFQTGSEEPSPERWRLHIIGPAVALYAGFVIAVTVLSMVR